MDISKNSASLHRFCVSCRGVVQNMVKARPDFCPFKSCFKPIPLINIEGRSDGFGRCQSCFTVYHSDWNFCEGCGLKSIDVYSDPSITKSLRKPTKSKYDIFCHSCGIIIFNGSIAKPRGCPKCFKTIAVREQRRVDGFSRCLCFKIVHKAWKFCENCGLNLKSFKGIVVPFTFSKSPLQESKVLGSTEPALKLSQSSLETCPAITSAATKSESDNYSNSMEDEFDMELMESLDFFETKTGIGKKNASAAKVGAEESGAIKSSKSTAWDDFEDKSRNRVKKRRMEKIIVPSGIVKPPTCSRNAAKTTNLDMEADKKVVNSEPEFDDNQDDSSENHDESKKLKIRQGGSDESDIESEIEDSSGVNSETEKSDGEKSTECSDED